MPLNFRHIFANSKVVIAIGSSLMITLMVSLTVVGLSHMANINQHLETIAIEKNERVDVLVSMRRIVRERSLTMYAIYLTEDPFHKDNEFVHFHSLAEKFIKLRLKLENLGVSEQQFPVYRHAMRLINRSAPLQSGIVEHMMDEDHTDVYTLMSGIDLPLEKEILATFDRLVDLERESARQAVATAKEQYAHAYKFMIILGALLAILGILITLLVIKRTSLIESALAQSKEQAEVTLHALWEAVITTDALGKVAYLNPAAERLTGWPAKQAIGKPLPEIYQLLDETDHKPVTHPVINGSIHGPVVGLKQHAILLCRSKQNFIVMDSASPLYSHDGRNIGNVLVSRDVTHERNLAHQLSWQAAHDGLTGLVNRREFEVILGRLISDVKINAKHHALLYMDLDQFKLVNDTCGHVAGDELLKQLAQLLSAKIRESDTLARLGGDEFGLLLEGCQIKQAERIANQLLDMVQRFRFVWKDKTFTLGLSIGLVPIDENSKDLIDTLSAADAACFIAKDNGRNRVWMHHTDDDDVIQRHGEMRWASRLREAVDANQFVLFIQQVKPINAASDGYYYEFLLRLKENNDQLVSPMAFIPAAERYNVMSTIDRWVIKTAFQWISNNTRLFLGSDTFSINISGQSLADEQFLDYCMTQYKNSNIRANQVCFEITETAAIANWAHAKQVLTVLKELGFKFALDDFGSGMSSFAYLKNLPLDFIKIDGSIVKDMENDQIDRTLVNVINQIGHVMNMKTIAEFVENENILKQLKQLGVDYAQGYGIHKPVPLHEAFQKKKLA